MACFRDDFWIWGHDAGAYDPEKIRKLWNLHAKSAVPPWEGAKSLGIPNCCRVVFDGKPRPPFDEASAELAGFRQVVWSVIGDTSSLCNNGGADDLDEVLRQAAKFPNVTGGILDDLFCAETKSARVTPERMREMAAKLHAAKKPMKLWIVCYPALFGFDCSAHLQAADVITFWQWTGEDLAHAEENLDRIIAMTPDKTHYAGCYLYNFGDACPLSDEEMVSQLELYRRLWCEGRIRGVIVCTNAVMGMGLNAEKILRNYLAKYGDTERRDA